MENDFSRQLLARELGAGPPLRTIPMSEGDRHLREATIKEYGRARYELGIRRNNMETIPQYQNETLEDVRRRAMETAAEYTRTVRDTIVLENQILVDDPYIVAQRRTKKRDAEEEFEQLRQKVRIAVQERAELDAELAEQADRIRREMHTVKFFNFYK